MPPHSLGKLIEWKLLLLPDKVYILSPPHSLGKLIEWKQGLVDVSFLEATARVLPTRWGN